MRLRFALPALAIFAFSSAARAQEPQPLPPPAQPTYVPGQPVPYVYQQPGAAPAPAPAAPPPAYQYQYQSPKEIVNYEEGDPVPPGYHPVERTRKGLVIAGTVTFTTLYFFSAIAALMDRDDGNHEAQALFIPVAGPFIQMTKTDGNDNSLDVLLALDGIGQGAGLFMLIYGLASTKTVLVRNDVAKPTVKVVPMRTATFSGLSLAGTF